MQICFPWSEPDLERWEKRPIARASAGEPVAGAYFDKHKRIVAVEPPGPPVPGGPYARAAQAIMAYGAFPTRIGRGIMRHREVEIGDTVGMLYSFIPGMKLFFAARVVELIREEREPLYRCGFLYQTLRWHPELGAETFCAEKDALTGEVRVFLQAWSRPAWWALPLLPMCRTLQLAAGRAALDHLEQIATG